ncbi:tRNA preQ1(34) S-adenosylmethionine ribosyltransferase-isomerase QueA [Haliangium sp.]|uniref:tRNA preQ1(34) S-adenosylmethionine ribosyltransferase-isomerase QueA n=1 Tax=Haliangium sp. TaxID=2663208 RepID=UPI003D0FB32E
MRLRRDYFYDLPAGQIAQTPAERRDASRLLVLDGDGRVSDSGFADVVELLPADAVVVVNDTRVRPARVRARKDTGGAVELLFLEPIERAEGRERWQCLARSSKPLRAGACLTVLDPNTREPAGVEVTIVGERGPDGTVVVELAGPGEPILTRLGELPLPPYIERPEGPTGADHERYQTVFACAPGAVAAPTAGLHFTPELIDALGRRGCTVAPLTLHVGPGTFAPVRSERIEDHHMHLERYEIPAATAALVSSGRPVVAVGTTCVRALESAAAEADARGEPGVSPGSGQTRLFITPGYHFRVVTHLITNFHLPESTLLMLVCAFAGYHPVMAAYRHAVRAGYRFFSYGDAMLVAAPSAASVH